MISLRWIIIIAGQRIQSQGPIRERRLQPRLRGLFGGARYPSLKQGDLSAPFFGKACGWLLQQALQIKATRSELQPLFSFSGQIKSAMSCVVAAVTAVVICCPKALRQADICQESCRVTRQILVEEAVLDAGGCVVRLAGLYHAQVGAFQSNKDAALKDCFVWEPSSRFLNLLLVSKGFFGQEKKKKKNVLCSTAPSIQPAP